MQVTAAAAKRRMEEKSHLHKSLHLFRENKNEKMV